MRFRNEDIEKIIEKLNIVEVIGEYVDLRKSGSNYKGLCPFHKDTNPSFIVSPTKNIYKCFVCGAGGNLIKFHMEFNKLTYSESIYELSQKYNLDIKPIKGEYSETKNKIYFEVLNEALNFFKNNIFLNSGRVALEYLNNRGFKPNFIKENSLGYAINSWDALYNHLINKNYEPNLLVTLGLIKNGEKGYYDTFRDRIIFPIYSPNGKIIAFGGRTMSDRKDIAKYLNSPDTPVFSKGKNLYGIKNRGQSIKKKNYAFLMEGYMDVLSAKAHGFDVALAPLGTAFSDDQAELLKRYTSNVIIAFDMDNPGRVACEKIGINLKKHGFNIRVLELKNAKDPDEFLRKYGKTEFLKNVQESKEIFEFLYDYYIKEYDISNPMAKQNFIERFKEFFLSVKTELEKSLYLNRLSATLDIDIDILKGILINNNMPMRVYKNSKIQPKKREQIKINELELETLKLCLKDVKYFNTFKNKTIHSPLVFKIFKIIEENKNKNYVKEFLQNNLLILEDEEKEIILNLSIEMLNKSEIEISNIYIELYKRWFNREIVEKMDFLKKNNIISFLECKNIYEQINNDIKLNDLEMFYEKFISIRI